MSFKMKLFGANALARQFGKDADAVDKEVRKEVFAMASDISLAAKMIVPEDKGNLKGTIRVKETGGKFNRNADIIAGGITHNSVFVDYAREQHENPNLRHKKGRRFKYLEEPWSKITGGGKAGKRISDAVKRAIS